MPAKSVNKIFWEKLQLYEKGSVGDWGHQSMQMIGISIAEYLANFGWVGKD
jgi:hypothetical protein